VPNSQVQLYTKYRIILRGTWKLKLQHKERITVMKTQ